MHSSLRFASAALASLLIAIPQADAAFPTTALKAICLQQIHSPTNILNAADGSGRLFICDQPGVIYIIQNGMLLPAPFLNLSAPAGGPVLGLTTGYSERGLLGMAFHPGFSNPQSPGYRKFYLNYTKTAGVGDPAPPQVGDPVNCTTVIAEFEVSAGNPNVALPGSERRLLLYTQPQSNHNGGQLEFGPDGFLYIGVGDGGSQDDNNAGHTGGSAARPTTGLGNSQDRTRFLGKILRIDPLDPDGAGPLTYSIPASNPFFNDLTPGIKKEIYAFGLRNPWKFCFDSRPGGTNRMFCGDVGGGRIEEVNIIVSGGNYGWRYKEGFEFPLFSSGAASAMPPGTPMADPGLGPYLEAIAQYAHPLVVTNPVLPQLGLSITGGYVYRGSAIPGLVGKYVFGDYGALGATLDGRLMGLEETTPGSGVFTLTNALPLLGTPNPITTHRVLCLGEDESGEIYVGLKTNTGVLLLDPPTTGFPAGGIYKFVPVQNTTTTLVPTHDNTIFSENTPVPPTTGYPSDALGYLWAGRTGPNHGPYLRRALMAFDVAGQVPSAAVVRSARLELQVFKNGPSSFGQTMSLHRLNETWGEGTSRNGLGVGTGAQATIGDATWVRRFFDTSSWTTPGGTFVATPSATRSYAGTPFAFNSTPALVADVQGWITNPASNAGWILRGDEVLEEAVVAFMSLQEGFSPPSLEINYDLAEPLTRFESWLRTPFNGGRFRVGEFVDVLADREGDGTVELLEYAYGFSPFDSQPVTAGLEVTAAYGTPDTVATITFRRDPRATDLNYYLETGSDLIGWTIITQSIGGADPTGIGFASEYSAPGDDAIRVVVANETLPSPAKRFVRLRVTQQASESSSPIP